MSKTPRRQCKKCPWRKGVDPYDIPNGYKKKKHYALSSTIAEPGVLRFDQNLHIMVATKRLPAVSFHALAGS